MRMRSFLLFAAAILLLPLGAMAAEGPCDAEASAVSVSVFMGNVAPMTSSDPLQAIFLAKGDWGQIVPMGCSASQCETCNNNDLKCKPVAGDCCCVEPSVE